MSMAELALVVAVTELLRGVAELVGALPVET
jgi:hypothetical protein